MKKVMQADTYTFKSAEFSPCTPELDDETPFSVEIPKSTVDEILVEFKDEKSATSELFESMTEASDEFVKKWLGKKNRRNFYNTIRKTIESFWTGSSEALSPTDYWILRAHPQTVLTTLAAHLNEMPDLNTSAKWKDLNALNLAALMVTLRIDPTTFGTRRGVDEKALESKLTSELKRLNPSVAVDGNWKYFNPLSPTSFASDVATQNTRRDKIVAICE